MAVCAFLCEMYEDAAEEVYRDEVHDGLRDSSKRARLCVQTCWCRCWIEDTKKLLAGKDKSPKQTKKPRTSPAHKVTLLGASTILSSHLLGLLLGLLGAVVGNSCKRVGG